MRIRAEDHGMVTKISIISSAEASPLNQKFRVMLPFVISHLNLPIMASSRCTATLDMSVDRIFRTYSTFFFGGGGNCAGMSSKLVFSAAGSCSKFGAGCGLLVLARSNGNGS
jgi:hypothetical protein